MSALICWNCGGSLSDIPRPISRHSTCSHCFNELHCCRLCRHYDPKRTMQCFEDRADPPLQKENANFCDFFAPRAGAFEAGTSTKSDAARGELDALFGQTAQPDEDMQSDSATSDTPDSLASDAISEDTDPTQPGAEEEARKKLNDLFR